MNVQIINSTPQPEQLTCTAARNDYRTGGVIEHAFAELMQDVSSDDDLLNEVLDERGYDEYEHIRDQAANFEPVKTEAKKRTLLRRLMDHGHWGPFEHPSATVAIEGITRTAMAQITRHRHFTFDIMSLRYVEVDGDVTEVCATPEHEDVESSREGTHDADCEETNEKFYDSYESSIRDYDALLDSDVPQEEARKVLPMGTTVNMVMSGNARAWMHLLNIRGKANVQGEARRIADALMDEMQEWMPFTFAHYDEEVLPLQLNP